jgi:hypothetical protein
LYSFIWLLIYYFYWAPCGVTDVWLLTAFGYHKSI